MKASRIFIIRHAHTVGTQNGWFYGKADLPISKEGEIEVLESKNKGIYSFATEESKFFTTGLKRTEQTLKLIFGDRCFERIEELQEMDFGDYECRSYEELKEDETFLKWGYDKTGEVALPNGESRNEFKNRVRKGWEKLFDEHMLLEFKLRHKNEEARSILLGHGGVTSEIMAMLFPEEKKTLWDWIPDPGTGYQILIENSKAKDYKKI